MPAPAILVIADDAALMDLMAEVLREEGERMETVHVRPEGLCALIATVPTVAGVATLATTVGELLGPRATPTIRQAARDRYALLTQAGMPEGPR